MNDMNIIHDERTSINWKVWNRWYSNRKQYDFTNIISRYDINQILDKNGIVLRANYARGEAILSTLYTYSKFMFRYGTIDIDVDGVNIPDSFKFVVELSAALSSPGIYTEIISKSGKYYIRMYSDIIGNIDNTKIKKIKKNKIYNIKIIWTPYNIHWILNNRLIHTETVNIPTNKLSLRVGIDMLKDGKLDNAYYGNVFINNITIY